MPHAHRRSIPLLFAALAAWPATGHAQAAATAGGLHQHVANSSVAEVWRTAPIDYLTPALTLFNRPKYAVASDGGVNNFFGMIANTLPAGSPNQPVAVGGYAINLSPGGDAVALFGRADARATGVVDSELDSFNFFGPPQAAFPLNRAIGKGFYPGATPVALTLAAGGQYASSLALEIGSEGSAPQPFVGGVYVHSDAITSFAWCLGSSRADQNKACLYQDGSLTLGYAQKGPAKLNVLGSSTYLGLPNVQALFGADFNAGDAANAGLVIGVANGAGPYIAPTKFGAGQTTPSNLDIRDANGAIVVEARPALLVAYAHQEFHGPQPKVSAGAGATVAGNDNLGRVILGGSPGAAITISFSAAWTNPPVCTFQDETADLVVRVSASSISQVTATAASGFTAGDRVAYRCEGFD